MKDCNKNVLLIWPSFDIPNMNFLPLGLGYIISNISKRYNISIKDFALDEYSDDILRELITEVSPFAVGISFWEMNYNATKHLVRKIKEYRNDTVVILGGPSASARKNSGLEDIEADFALKGEGEESFEVLLDLVSADRTKVFNELDKVPGITYFHHTEKAYRSMLIRTLDLNNIRYPDYEKIRLHDYFNKGY
jgi:radical SAM superfamily enzyme YgiQ (UPF0313 family)